MDIIAEKLKALRLQHGLSQDLLAKQSGLSLRTIQRLERDGGGSAESLLALSATLNVSPMALRNEQGLPIAHWSFVSISCKAIACLMLLAITLALIMLASNGRYTLYIDIISLLFLALFLPSVTIITLGFAGLKRSISGLRLLFSQQLYGTSQLQQLRSIYRLQYRLCYNAALLCSLFGLVSVFHYSVERNSSLLFSGLSVLTLAWLYAAMLAELVYRPLIFKLQQAIQQQSTDAA
ncbi:helix-turn-helix domain-containing protein [Alishewanella sp. SMS8]|uniref:helix-turn-helix domain-containing protein n=1 Tax=Alishewanella sp. SMS8 TaxID=2994676 RepID=UPI00274194A5|nr:helix-turn-helix transcriptional regulator [Alishewanella sp. SMS8]MDP5460006.1 helix-turn-helix transcriptional regulator [Alishewanella sp. SMS8]